MSDQPIKLTPEQEFAARVQRTAVRQLEVSLGTEAGKKAAQSIVMAFMSAMRTSRSARDFTMVTDASIADCVATSAATELYPGGPNPTVYLVPQRPRKDAQPELQWRITHRGLAILASRAGFGLLPVPVGNGDHLQIAYGEAVEHRADPAVWPESLKDIQGVILVVRRISDGLIISRAWVPRGLIEKRRAKARDQGVWNEWPMEQAQKTAIKWAAARGLIPMDSPELRAALEADVRGEIVDVEPLQIPTTRQTGRAALGLSSDIPDTLEDAAEEPVRVVIDADEFPL